MGNPYISGEYILGQLNRAFGFDGWSVEILSMNEESVDQVNGKFKATFSCRVELTVYAGDRIIKRHGVGAHAMFSRNLVDVVANGQAAPTRRLSRTLQSPSVLSSASTLFEVVEAGRTTRSTSIQFRQTWG